MHGIQSVPYVLKKDYMNDIYLMPTPGPENGSIGGLRKGGKFKSLMHSLAKFCAKLGTYESANQHT